MSKASDETPDYTVEELKSVAEFYAQTPNKDYFREFFLSEGSSTRILVDKFIINRPAEEKSPDKGGLSDEETKYNSIDARSINQKLLDESSAYGDSATSVHLVANNDPTAQETFQVVCNWLSPDVSVGYNTHKTLEVALVRSKTGAENSYTLRFDKLLSVADGVVRIVETFDPQEMPMFGPDEKRRPPLPKAIQVFYAGKVLVEYKIKGYSLENAKDDVVPNEDSNSKFNPRLLFTGSGIDTKLSRFMCGLKPGGGGLFGIGNAESFVLFTSPQQIRAATVLFVAKLFAYASIWRIFFAFVNSLGASIAFLQNSKGWENRLKQCADSIETQMGETGFFKSVSKENELGDEPGVPLQFTDNNDMEQDGDLAEMFRVEFQSWERPANLIRLANVETQADRIEIRAFVSTRTYREFLERVDSERKEGTERLTELINYVSGRIENVKINQSAMQSLPIDENDNDVMKFKTQFEKKFSVGAFISTGRTTEDSRSSALTVIKNQRDLAQQFMDRALRFELEDPVRSPLAQLLTRLIVSQQLLRCAGILTDALSLFAANRDVLEKDRLANEAPLRASERRLALFAARNLIEAMNIERRAGGGVAERYIAELEALVVNQGGNGQVPVPDYEVLQQLIKAVEEMQSFTEKQAVDVFQVFYQEQRFYFADVARIPWTASGVDSDMLRNVILDAVASNTATALLNSAIFRLNGVYTKSPENPGGIESREFKNLVQPVEDAATKIRKEMESANASITAIPRPDGEQPASSLFVVQTLRRVLALANNYFMLTETLRKLNKITENALRYNAIIGVEKAVSEVLKLYNQKVELPNREEALESGEDVDGILDRILGTVVKTMEEDVSLKVPSEAL